jgi:MFS family permease
MINPDSNKQTKYFGWQIVAGVMLVYGSICGNIIYAYGVFLPAMSEAFHWSRSAFSGPYAAFLLIGGMLGPVAGITVARFGARKNIIIFNLIAVLGLLGMSQVTEIWHVYIFFGLMSGVGIAFGEFIPLTTVINQWFIQKRAWAMGLLFASGGIGGFVLPPLISWFISGFGWRWTWVFLAGIHLLAAVMLGGFLIRSRPEDIRQVPDGHFALSGQKDFQQPDQRRIYQTAVDWTLGAALCTPAFWMIMTIFSLILFATNMLTTHQVAYLQDLNYSPMAAATALGLMLGMSIIGRLVCGALGARIEGRYLAAFFLGIMGLGIISLMYARGMFFIYSYSVLTGIGFGGMIVLMPNMIGAYFGRTHYSRIVGWAAPLVMLVSASSPYMAGFLYDRTGKYFIPFFIASALIFGSIFIALLARPPQMPPNRE